MIDHSGGKENQNVEWKQSWRDAYLKWVCGFANADGGLLVVGRDDDGVAVGIPNARRLLEEIPNKVRNLFFRAGLIEAWGRGIERIIEACRDAGTPEPEVRVEPSGVWVVFRFLPEHQVVSREKTTQERILAILALEPSITRKTLAKRIGIGEDGVKYHLGKLKSAGVIQRVGSTKAGHWEVVK